MIFKSCVDVPIFQCEPTFRRGLVLATALDNRGFESKLNAELQEAVRDAAAHPVDLADDERTAVWRDAHRAFGSNPNRFLPAHLALRKRVQRASAALPFISPSVAIMNATSIRHLVPVGGDDLNRVAEFGTQLELRVARGNEIFVPLGHAEQQDHPEPGEVIYTVGSQVMCRRWNWRNSHSTRITEVTEALLMNIDGLGEDSESKVLQPRDTVAQFLERFCHADVVTGLLTPTCPVFSFEL